MERLRLALLSVVGPAILCGLCAGCTDRDLIRHSGVESQTDFDTGAHGSDVTGFGGDDEGDGSPLGNFPDPAIPECGALPPGVDPIPGLATSWVVTGNVPGTDSEGTPYPDDQARLRLADYGVACDERLGEASIDGCFSAWSYEISLAIATLQPGVYELSALGSLYPEMIVSDAGPEGCGGVGVGGGGVAPGAEPQGELEIFSVTGGCVVGELRDLSNDFGDLDIDRNGGFVAMRCESDCVPMIGNDCG